jgi:Flp pilus assembly protein TadG
MSATCTRTAKPAGVRDGSAIVPAGTTNGLAGLVRGFARDRSGAVAMIFGLMLIPMAAMIGLAVDFGRVYAVNSSTQGALDAAALAAGRVAQVETSDIIGKASAAATAYFNQTKPKNVVSSTVQFSPNSAETAFTVTATSWVRTPFLGALDFIIKKDSQSGAPTVCNGSYFNCVKLTTTSTAELKAGGDGGSNVEVAMMLDVTGSMCTPCTKIDDAKAAAKDLVDIVVWSDQSQYTSRIALAPFAEAVNVGKTLAPLVRGTVTSGTPTLTNSDMSNTSVQPTKQNLK